MSLCCLLYTARVVTLATPSALCATSPKRGSASRQRFATGAPIFVFCNARDFLSLSRLRDSSLVRGSQRDARCFTLHPLAPLLGELARRSRLRGRRSLVNTIREKRRQCTEYHCHCEVSDRCHWPWQSASLLDSSVFLRDIKENGFPRRFAPRNDRLFYTPLFLFPSAPNSALETPSALRATSPKRGSAPRQRFKTGAPIWAALRGKDLRLASSPPTFFTPQVLFNLIRPRIHPHTPPYHAKGDSHGTDSRRPDHRRDAPHRLAALDADRGSRRRWLGSGLSSRSCKTASFTA